MQSNNWLRGIGVLGLFLLNGVGAWLLYSRYAINHNMPLPTPFPDAERGVFKTKVGNVAYFADRSATGRPLVLIHSINAAGCAREMYPLFQHYRGTRPVYALDLPGFGLSDRPDTAYTPQLYADAITALLQEVVGEPADVVALSLASEFTAIAAQNVPNLVNSLALLAPTGLSNTTRPDESVYDTLAFPLWGQALFDLLATEASLKFFLGQVFYGDVPADYIEYAYLTTHRPGGHHAPLYFVSGQLFTPDIRPTVYQQLEMPIHVIYGDDPNVGYGALDALLKERPNWSATRFKYTRALPHWDQLEDTIEELSTFWG